MRLFFKIWLFLFPFGVQVYMPYLYGVDSASCLPRFIFLFANRALICLELQCAQLKLLVLLGPSEVSVGHMIWFCQ